MDKKETAAALRISSAYWLEGRAFGAGFCGRVQLRVALKSCTAAVAMTAIKPSIAIGAFDRTINQIVRPAVEMTASSISRKEGRGIRTSLIGLIMTRVFGLGNLGYDELRQIGGELQEVLDRIGWAG